MTELNPRLSAIAGEIKQGEIMADIGSDHGFLPLYLRERRICPLVIVTDANYGPLARAMESFYKADLGEAESADFRLGDGLEVLKSGEADAVVIAGMGGILISEILDFDPQKSRSFKRLILQPRNHSGILRKWLGDNGFIITNEQLAREGRYICEIITARSERPAPQPCAPELSGAPDAASLEPAEYRYPESLLYFRGPLTEEYLRAALRKERYILEQKEKSRSADAGGAEEQRRTVEHLERLVEKL